MTKKRNFQINFDLELVSWQKKHSYPPYNRRNNTNYHGHNIIMNSIVKTLLMQTCYWSKYFLPFMIHYHIHNGKPMDPLLSQMNPIYIITYYFKINFLIAVPSTSELFLRSNSFLRSRQITFYLQFLSLQCMLHVQQIQLPLIYSS
jgi:hypothetical protein